MSIISKIERLLAGKKRHTHKAKKRGKKRTPPRTKSGKFRKR